MEVTLLVETGPDKGRKITLPKQAVVLGKSAECDIKVPSTIVSRRHCRISIEKDFVVLRDLRSKNGTFLNDRKVGKDVFLASGDKIRLGQAVFTVLIGPLHGDTGAAEIAAIAEEESEEKQKEEAAAVVEEAQEVKEEIPVAEAVEETSEPTHEAQIPEAAEAQVREPEAPAAYTADFYRRVAECMITAREDFFEHYRGSTRRTRNILAMLVGILGLSEEEAKLLDLAGLLYDVGKLLLPDTMFNKRGPLTPEEKKIMQRHPQASVVFFKEAGLPGEVREAILAHHERYDGTGYPKQLKGDAIPKPARVLALADSLSAMTSSRPHRTSMSTAQAIDEIERGAGTHFDPEMARRVADYCRLNMGELRRAITFKR